MTAPAESRDDRNANVRPISDMAAAIDSLNSEYAVMLYGGSFIILHERTDEEGRLKVDFMTENDFHRWEVTRTVDFGGKKVPASKLWITSPLRRKYEGIVFDPSEMTPPTYYNLWKGFALEQADRNAKVSCQRFLDHVANNVCDGNPEWFAWVMGFFADMIQNPADKPGVALVLRGTQGTGKTLIGETIAHLVGKDHSQLVSDPQRIVGRFNGLLEQCLFLQLDEATWGGEHAAAGRLKDFITGEWQYIERKNREPVRVRNHARLFVTGNNDWLVPAAREERRFAVFDMAEVHRQDSAYFGAIVRELENGGYEALLRYLKDFDLSDVNLRSIPETPALAEQKSRSLDVSHAWWLDILHRGVLPGDLQGDGETDAHALYVHYMEYSRSVGETRRMSENLFGRMVRKLVPMVLRTRKSFAKPSGGYNRPYYYAFPPLADCRATFDRVVGEEGWDDPDTWLEDAK